ncbi:metallophosphoesterase [Evansella sp. AB-rgal1]|uniref:metallophosphoesterase family protein n=1 Tax=Evansella sp. AB-rgal1 TaxID=3242696 RepID=UPI00359EF7E5
MKLAFISDIHGNAVALEAVLKDIERKEVDKIVVLGDICYRGPEPKRSLEIIRSLDTIVLKGNADEWVVRGVNKGEVPDAVLEGMREEREWITSKLDESDLDYLKNLPTYYLLPVNDTVTIHCFHATPTSLFEVVKPDDTEMIQSKLLENDKADIFLYGHIHHPYVRFINGKAVANLGSVGLPFDGLAKSSYAIVEVKEEGFTIGIHRVTYDLEKVIKQYEEEGYPNLNMRNIIKNGKL